MRRYLLGLAVLLLILEVLSLASDIRSTGTESATIVVPDDFLTIQMAINNAVDGDTIFVKTGTYYEHVVVNKTVSLVGEDVKTTIIDGNNTGHVINVISDNVSISGSTIKNSGNVHWPALEAGICLNSTTDCIISENRLIDNGFAGISLLNSQRNTITDNNVTGTGWVGIHLLSSSHSTISGNVLHNNIYVGINGHASSHYNSITENIISNSTYGMFYHDSSHNNICRNNISTIAVEGIWLQDQVNYNIVAENSLINNTAAIRVQGPNYNNTLSRNVITGAEYGIKIQNYARYTHIADNVIMNNRAGNDSWSAGIRLDSGWDSKINLNIISGNCYGILLYSASPRVSMIWNNITGNEFGLRVASAGSNYLNVSDNIVMNNRGYGIGLTGFGGASNYATISRNLIVNNSDGIALGQYSNYNTIIQNNISQNGYGSYVEYSTQNTIWRNNIVENDQQVYVSTGSVNNWDAGYPAGGNYWSDYNGNDTFCGLNQDLPGSDGKGDTPYAIDENNQDNYPLMNSYRGLDVTPPQFVNWTQNPPGEEIRPDASVTVTIDAMDESGVKSVILLYKHNGTGSWSSWIEIAMNHTAGNTYEAIVSPFQGGTIVEYCINVTDFFDNWCVTPDEGYSYTPCNSGIQLLSCSSNVVASGFFCCNTEKEARARFQEHKVEADIWQTALLARERLYEFLNLAFSWGRYPDS